MGSLLEESLDILEWLDPNFEMFMAERGWGCVTRPNFHNATETQKWWTRNYFRTTGTIPDEPWVTMVVFHLCYSETLMCAVCIAWEECSPKRFNRLIGKGDV